MAAADFENAASDRFLILEFRRDHPVVVDPEMLRYFLGKFRVPKRCKSRQLALVAEHFKAAGLCRMTVGPG